MNFFPLTDNSAVILGPSPFSLFSTVQARTYTKKLHCVQICLQQNRPNSAAMMLAIHAIIQLFNKTCMPKQDACMTTALDAPQERRVALSILEHYRIIIGKGGGPGYHLSRPDVAFCAFASDLIKQCKQFVVYEKKIISCWSFVY